MSDTGHGSVGTREQQFTHLLPLRDEGYPTDLLMGLAAAMKSEPDGVHDGPDPEENLWVPAGYTYFGQFVDHDLTFDNTSSLNPKDDGDGDRRPTNLRSPRFDLDSLYGDGPDAMPYLYESDGASLLLKDGEHNQVSTTGKFNDQARLDLLRSPNGRAIIGDKRNDENVIVGQIQLLFVRYHNKVVKVLNEADPSLTGTALFEHARQEVCWTYQTLVLKDFLPRIVRADVQADLQMETTAAARANCYYLYTEGLRQNLPREFVVAAYRYGHSGVRQGYRLNGTESTDFPTGTMLNIFAGSDEGSKHESLLGFKPLPATHVIDSFARFFPSTVPGPLDTSDPPRQSGGDAPIPKPPILQYAYKLDTNIADPLGALPLNVLPTSDAVGGLMVEVAGKIAPQSFPPTHAPTRPSLALLNLLRGDTYRVQSGQTIAQVLQNKGVEEAKPLGPATLVVRTFTEKKKDNTPGAPDAKVNFYKFVAIDEALQQDTPLWFYILAEAQAPIAEHFGVGNEFSETLLLNGVGALTQLGWVGGRIITEVFFGLLDSDDASVVNAPADWKPMLGGDGQPIFMNLVKFVEGS